MLKRLLIALLFLTASAQAAATDYTDIWFNPQEAGWGMKMSCRATISYVSDFSFTAPTAINPTWFYRPRSRSTARATTTARCSRRSAHYTSLPALRGASFTAAGNASFQPLDSYTAKLVYTVNNVGTVTKTIQRQPLTSIPLSGDYTGGLVLQQSQCANAGVGTLTLNASISQPVNNSGPTTIAISRADGMTCNFVGPLTQWGKLYQMPNATYTCSNGRNTTARVDEIEATAHGIEGQWSAFVEGSCVETGTFSAVLRQ